MVPASEGAPLEVVEAKLALHLFVGPLRTPALLDGADDVLLAHPARERGEDVLGRLRLALGPLDHEPQGLALRHLGAVVVSDLDAPKPEVAREPAPPGRLVGPVAPRVAAEVLPIETRGDLRDRERLEATAACGVEQPRLRAAADGHRVVEPEVANPFPERERLAVRRVGEDDLAGDLILDGALDEIECELGLRLEDDVLGDARLRAARGIVGPPSRQVEREVERHVLRARAHYQAHSDLAVADLPERPRVLPLHADRVRSLLGESSVVDDPRRHRLSRAEHRRHVGRGLPPHGAVVPRTVADEVQQPIVHPLARALLARRARRDRLHALALAVGQQPVRVGRERCPLLRPRKMPADIVAEELLQPPHADAVYLERHAPAGCTSWCGWKSRRRRMEGHSAKQTTWNYTACPSRARAAEVISRSSVS